MKLIFLDTETTGLNAWKYGKTHHEITELAIIVHEDGEEVYRNSWKFVPRRIETADTVALEIGGFNLDVWELSLIHI